MINPTIVLDVHRVHGSSWASPGKYEFESARLIKQIFPIESGK
jgi:hypothetical protein